MIHEVWTEDALAVHTLIYGVLSRAFHQKENRGASKNLLNKAMSFVETLDDLIINPSENRRAYVSTYRALFLLLKYLHLDQPLEQQIAEQWGADCFFIKLLKEGEPLCV